MNPVRSLTGNFLWFKLWSCRITLLPAPRKIFLTQNLVPMITSIPLWAYEDFKSIHGPVLGIPTKENRAADINQEDWNETQSVSRGKTMKFGSRQAPDGMTQALTWATRLASNSLKAAPREPPAQRRSAHHTCVCVRWMPSDKWHTQKPKKQSAFFNDGVSV